MRPNARPARRIAGVVIALIALLVSAQGIAQQEPEAQGGPPGGPKDSPRTLSTLQPTIARFDFDSRDAPPGALPSQLYRYIDPSAGFPPFGSMGVIVAGGEPDVAAAANRSLRFELGGGSMSARLNAAVAPVLPMSDYIVSCRVRTDGLRYAGARLVAWLLDERGEVIAPSRVHSALTRTDGAWRTLSVEVRGEFRNATDLILELQLAQPSLLATPIIHESGRIIEPENPRFEDISGTAWFDDISIAHLPRVELFVQQRGNVVRLPQQPVMVVRVNDAAAGAVTARLRVFDLRGDSVFDAPLPSPRSEHGATVHLPVDRCGWYRAVLDISSGGIDRLRWTDFVILPARDRRRDAIGHPFGIDLDERTIDDVDVVAAHVSTLRCSHVLAPAWRSEALRGTHSPHTARLRALAERLVLSDAEVSFSLHALPAALAREVAVDPDAVLEVLAGDAQQWRPYLEDMLTGFGMLVRRWQIGSPVTSRAFYDAALEQRLSAATGALAAFVPEPIGQTAWSAEQMSESVPLLAAAVTIPPEVAPDRIEALMEPWSAADLDLRVRLQPLVAGRVAQADRVADLAQRALYAWRAGLSRITIDAPWRSAPMAHEDASTSIDPGPAFPLWRTLADQLAGRAFVGELALSSGLHAWIVRGVNEHDSCVIAWSDAAGADGPAELRAQLADGAVDLIDSFGNVTRIEPIDGEHIVPLSAMPVFISGVDLELVQFRSSIAIEPDFVPAVSRLHEHTIRIANPWSVTIAGSIRLRETGQWRVSPATQSFTIPAGGEVRLPLNIIPDRGILAGAKTFAAEVNIEADRTYRMAIELDVNVGLETIELNASYTTVKNRATGEIDLIIMPAVTNRSAAPVNVDVDVLAPGLSLMRRTIQALAPGETQVRSLRIPNGATLLQGRQVRIGVAERDGVAKLNRTLTISAAPIAAAPVRE